MKTTTYNGNDVFVPLNFNLYPHEDINFEETVKNLIRGFRNEFEADIRNRLGQVGLSFVALKWFSPKQYNYLGDSIDLEVLVQNKRILKKAILKNKDKINEELSNNKSYDGYMALTVKDIDEELANIDFDTKKEHSQHEVDSIVLKVLLSPIDFSLRFNIYDYFAFEYLCSGCGENVVNESGDRCNGCVMVQSFA
ncbi:MAG: hypothetical protein KJI69_05330 [Patescibacteria group bacterium]|nr:hypothetical protein [Patescibacteria group bacterium]